MAIKLLEQCLYLSADAAMRKVDLKYKDIFVRTARRVRGEPRVVRPWRTRKLMNLTAFFRNRFYEIDRWYKARIEKPITYPNLYTIDPVKYSRSLELRMKEERPPSCQRVNIGFKWEPSTIKAPERSAEEKAKLEMEARKLTLNMDLEEVEENSWKESQPERVMLMAEHFGIYKDLFDRFSYFYPVVKMDIGFPVEDSEPPALRTIHFGNLIQPSEAVHAPDVEYTADEGTYWLLLLVNPDGNIYVENKEVLHWLVGNIPGNRIESGECVCDYLQPLPLRGTGLHRFVFLLFKQKEHCDFASLKGKLDGAALRGRTFSTFEFYNAHEESITPAGLVFFQSEWDPSCSSCFHDRLGMKEPMYKYNWPPPYVPPQQIIPDEPQPFNEYLDKYRDAEDVEAELLLKRLSRMCIKSGGPTRLTYPNIFYEEERLSLPSWLHLEKYKENLGVGKYKAIYENRLD